MENENMETIFRDDDGNNWLLKDACLAPYGIDDQAIIKSISYQNFLNNGFNLSKEEFNEFMFSIVSPDKEYLTKWLVAHSNKNIYKRTQAISIHPLIAYRILQKFNFKSYKNATGIIKIESINSWLDHFMKGKIQDDGIRKMISNENTGIFAFLKNIMDFINANPAILNRQIINIGKAYQIIHKKI